MRILIALACVVCVLGCSSTYKSETKSGKTLRDEVNETIGAFKDRDPSMSRFFDGCYGHAVFPSVGKGAVGIGGAHGTGEVFEQGEFVGRARLTQGTIGLALGGQVFSEIIFFQTETALRRFKEGKLEFSANASAVAVDKGAAAQADYDAGVAVFTMPKGGLMFEASIGGQKFEFIEMPR